MLMIVCLLPTFSMAEFSCLKCCRCLWSPLFIASRTRFVTSLFSLEQKKWMIYCLLYPLLDLKILTLLWYTLLCIRKQIWWWEVLVRSQSMPLLLRSYAGCWEAFPTHTVQGIEWYLEKRGSRKILARSWNLGSVFDGSRSLVFEWFF